MTVPIARARHPDCVLCHLMEDHEIVDEHSLSELVRFHRNEHAWGDHDHEHANPGDTAKLPPVRDNESVATEATEGAA